MDDQNMMDEDIVKVLYTPEQIAEHVKRVGAAISRDYVGRDIVLVGILRGASVFMADLIRQITVPLEMDFMAVSSYGSHAKSSGVVRIIKDLSSDISGRDVLIVEDILDSGLTLKYLMKNLASRGPASVNVAYCFEKEGVQKVEIPSPYERLKVPNEFVVGYGLDYAEHYRNLPYLGVLDPKIYS